MSSIGVPLVPAVILLTTGAVSDIRQAQLVWQFAEGRGLTIVAWAGHQPASALATVRVGTAAAVVASLEPIDVSPAFVALTRGLAEVGAELLYARPSAAVRTAVSKEAELVATALANSGGDIDLVSRLLGVPVEQVRAAADAMAGRSAASRRPTIRGR